MATEDVQQQRLLDRIKSKRAEINAYLNATAPRNARLINISIISSTLATVLTAGPALGGEKFTETLQQIFGLQSDSTVWRVLCLGAMVVSIIAAVATNLQKSSDETTRIATARACAGKLESLETSLDLGFLSLADAGRLYQQYVTEVPFIQERASATKLPAAT